MRKEVISVVLFILVSAFCSMGQINGDQTNDGSGFGMMDKNWLPDGPDAWVVHLITVGGFSGRGLPAVTIISDGSYACGQRDPLIFKPVPLDKIAALSQIINTAALKPDSTMEKGTDDKEVVCSDCYQTSLTLTRRETNGKTRTYNDTGKLIKYKPIAENFGLIGHFISDLDLCALK